MAGRSLPNLTLRRTSLFDVVQHAPACSGLAGASFHRDIGLRA